MFILDYKAIRLNHNEEDLKKYQGKVILVVNTASKCGFTKQYTALEEIYKKYKEQGLVILGFPCNQFGSQESGSDDSIAEFCKVNFGVTFPMFSKIKVNGKDAHPFYKELKKRAPGLLGTERIKWNFTKFLISRDTNRIERFAPNRTPESIADFIEKELAENLNKND